MRHLSIFLVHHSHGASLPQVKYPVNSGLMKLFQCCYQNWQGLMNLLHDPVQMSIISSHPVIHLWQQLNCKIPGKAWREFGGSLHIKNLMDTNGHCIVGTRNIPNSAKFSMEVKPFKLWNSGLLCTSIVSIVLLWITLVLLYIYYHTVQCHLDEVPSGSASARGFFIIS